MAEGRRITWIGTAPNVTAAEFTAFDAALRAAPFALERIGGPDFVQQGGGGQIRVASTFYSDLLSQALVKPNPAGGSTIYLNMLVDGVPDIAALKATVQSVFGFTGVTILEDTVTL